jgi:hypothetical protein
LIRVSVALLFLKRACDRDRRQDWAVEDLEFEASRDCWFCSWRLAAWLGLLPSLLATALALALPDSPRWCPPHPNPRQPYPPPTPTNFPSRCLHGGRLALKGRGDAATKALHRLRGTQQTELLSAEIADVLANAAPRSMRLLGGADDMPARIFIGLVIALTTQASPSPPPRAWRMRTRKYSTCSVAFARSLRDASQCARRISQWDAPRRRRVWVGYPP